MVNVHNAESALQAGGNLILGSYMWMSNRRVAAALYRPQCRQRYSRPANWVRPRTLAIMFVTTPCIQLGSRFRNLSLIQRTRQLDLWAYLGNYFVLPSSRIFPIFIFHGRAGLNATFPVSLGPHPAQRVAATADCMLFVRIELNVLNRTAQFVRSQ